MRYFRQLKDAPACPAGTIFVHKFEDSWGWGYYDVSDSYMAFYNPDVVENQPEWFEEVERIFVRQHNAEKLQELDRLSDGVKAEIGNYARVVVE